MLYCISINLNFAFVCEVAINKFHIYKNKYKILNMLYVVNPFSVFFFTGKEKKRIKNILFYFFLYIITHFFTSFVFF